MADEFAPIRSTGIGSFPGADLAEALKINFAECPELPYLPELPARGVGSGMIGRGVAVLSGLSADLQPAGWRLTDAPGRDQLRARATLRDDLDQLEEAVQDYAGPFKIAFCGPWTLSASVERPRGDRTLADHGARRDLGQSLAAGIGELVVDLGRRLPQLELIVQLDEPLLPAVLAGEIPTASGFSHHRRVDLPEVSERLTDVVTAITRGLPTPGGADLGEPAVAAEQSGTPLEVTERRRQTEAEARTGASATGSEVLHSDDVAALPRTWLHSCAPNLPVKLIKDAGLGGVAVDLDQLRTGDWDVIGQAMTDGLWLGAGALSTATGEATQRQWSADRVAERVLRATRALGLEPDVAGRMILTPACGLARFDERSAVNALRAVHKAADIVTDQLAD